MSIDTADAICFDITAFQAALAVAQYEAIAAEFGFEPYGTPAEEAASYNRRLKAHTTELNRNINELRERLARTKQHDATRE